MKMDIAYIHYPVKRDGAFCSIDCPQIESIRCYIREGERLGKPEQLSCKMHGYVKAWLGAGCQTFKEGRKK